MTEGIYAGAGEAVRPETLDAIIFDCDGVLVDVSRSYDHTIRDTARHILEGQGMRDPVAVTPQMIEGFKATGGFNDEVDLTYGIILAAAAAHKLGENQEKVVMDAIKNSDHTGIISTQKYLEGRADISGVVRELDYPGRDSPLYTAFNEIFYGSDLFERIYKRRAVIAGEGLVKNDRPLMDPSTMEYLCGRFDRNIAIVTGRSAESIRCSLELDGFNLAASFFLEDEPRSMAKPNPEALIRSISAMGAGHCLYVGDSAEDLIMAQEASRAGARATFCGIIGTSADPQGRLEMFMERGAQLALDSVCLLPKALNQTARP